MWNKFKKIIKKESILASTNIENNTIQFPIDYTEFEISIINQVLPYTMTSIERLYNLIKSVQYIIQNNIKGDFVECGVWKGGSVMAIALTLQKLSIYDRKIYLYDTFEGMPPATEYDKSVVGEDAIQILNQTNRDEKDHVWAYSPLDKVQNNLKLTNYPFENFKFVKGKVEETIPKTIPNSISILRLDTDWYESTKYELDHLFPILERGGVLFIDDYGHWKGAKKATDEYIQKNNIQIFLTRIDYTCRVGIKN